MAALILIDKPEPPHTKPSIRIARNPFNHPQRPALVAQARGSWAFYAPPPAVLASYGLSSEEAVHAARRLRCVAHGFATLEVAGGSA